MIRWSAVLLAIGVVSAFFAYGDIEPQAALYARTVFFVCSALFVLSIFAAPLRKTKS